MNLEDQIMNEMAKEISAEIDFGVMSEMMVAQGWHKVELGYFTNNKIAVDIAYWAEEHSKFKFIKHGRMYVFEDAGDAINFSLRWK